MTVVSISMPDELLERIDEFADEHGYTGRSEVFREAGRNLLELPVVLRGTAGGALRAGIRYDGESRHFQLQLQPHAPQESGLGLNGRTA